LKLVAGASAYRVFHFVLVRGGKEENCLVWGLRLGSEETMAEKKPRNRNSEKEGKTRKKSKHIRQPQNPSQPNKTPKTRPKKKDKSLSDKTETNKFLPKVGKKGLPETRTEKKKNQGLCLIAGTMVEKDGPKAQREASLRGWELRKEVKKYANKKEKQAEGGRGESEIYTSQEEIGGTLREGKNNSPVKP